MFDDSWDKFLVFLFGVLFIENAIFGFLEACAAKAVGRCEYAFEAVGKIVHSIPAVAAKTKIVEVYSAALRFVHALGARTPCDVIHAILRISDQITVAAISAFAKAEGIEAIFGFVDVIAGDVIILLARECFARMAGSAVFQHDFCSLNMVSLTKLKIFYPCLILILRELFVKHTIVFLTETYTSKTIAAASAIKEKCAVSALLAKLGIQ